MANVSVYNIEGKEVGTMELNLRLVPKYPAAEESPGDRKEPVMLDRVRQELRSGQAAAWYSLPLREIILSD